MSNERNDTRDRVDDAVEHRPLEKGGGEPVLSESPVADELIEAGSRAEADHPAGHRRRSPWQLLWLKLRRNHMAMAGLIILVLLYAGAIFAGFISPYGYENQRAEYSFHPPMLTRIHLFDEHGDLSRPFVYGVVITDKTAKGYEGFAEDRSVKYPIRFFVRGDPYHILWIVRSNIHLFGVDEPGFIYLFGSDLFGQDIFSRIMYGAQISLSVGIVGIIISTAIGMLVGGLAGYLGGAVDFISMRAVEILLAIPSLYFILILRQAFGDKYSSTQTYLLVVIILSLIGWATEARVIRGMVLKLKEQEYVLAARALGFSKTRIIVRHILPNTLSFVIVTATLSVPFFILSEVALSFLGVGIQQPEPSWGNMLSAAQNVAYLSNFTWILLPGVFIFISVLAWNFLGDGLRDAIDPRTGAEG